MKGILFVASEYSYYVTISYSVNFNNANNLFTSVLKSRTCQAVEPVMSDDWLSSDIETQSPVEIGCKESRVFYSMIFCADKYD